MNYSEFKFVVTTIGNEVTYTLNGNKLIKFDKNAHNIGIIIDKQTEYTLNIIDMHSNEC